MNYKIGALLHNFNPRAKGRSRATTQRRTVYLQLCKLPNAQLSSGAVVNNEIVMLQAFPPS